jgi:hypothetical protein
LTAPLASMAAASRLATIHKAMFMPDRRHRSS